MDLRRHRLDAQPARPVDDDCPEEPPAGATTDVEAYYIIRSLSRKEVNCARVQMRSSQVLLDGYEGKPLAQLNLQRVPAQVVLFPAGESTCYQLNSINDLYDMAEVIRSSIRWYEREFPIKPHVPDKEVMA